MITVSLVLSTLSQVCGNAGLGRPGPGGHVDLRRQHVHDVSSLRVFKSPMQKTEKRAISLRLRSLQKTYEPNVMQTHTHGHYQNSCAHVRFLLTVVTYCCCFLTVLQRCGCYSMGVYYCNWLSLAITFTAPQSLRVPLLGLKA